MKAALLALFVIACGKSATSPPVQDDPTQPPGGEQMTSAVADSLVPIARVDGSTFIEILEVAALPDGRLVYCTGVRGLQVVDARDPTAMRVTVELRSSKYSHQRFARCQHLAVDGNRVFFTNRGDMIQKTPFISGFDLSTSPPTEILNHTAPNSTFEGIAARDGKLYVAMHDRGLAVYEVGESGLRELSVVGGFKAAWAVALAGNNALVADASGALVVVDVSDAAKAKPIGKLDLPGSAQSIAVVGNRAFVAAGARGLLIIDISEPTEPKLISETDTAGTALQVTVDGDRAFVANWGDARIYDVSNAEKPTLLAAEIPKTEEKSSRVLGMSGLGDIAFVGEWTGMYAYKLRPDAVAPHAVTNKTRVDFGRTPQGAKATIKVALENHGNAPLEIKSVRADGSFTVSAGESPVAPGQFAVLEVGFNPKSNSPASSELVIETNDPDDGQLRIPLAGNPKGLDVGDAAPEIPLALIDGGQFKLSEQRGKIVLLAYFATF